MINQATIENNFKNSELQDEKKILENKKLKEDYRRNIKNKSYSRSIDTNMQKFNYLNAVAASALSSLNNNTSNQTNHPQSSQQNNPDTLANRLKANKNKK